LLFDGEGWWPERDESKLARLLQSGLAVAGWRGHEVVAFARAVTDDGCRAYIEDVVVGQDHRRHGIGGRLVRALHEELGGGMIVTAFFHN
jgi:predicted GNAT family acetyltransferase